jgi:hypothetical protein
VAEQDPVHTAGGRRVRPVDVLAITQETLSMKPPFAPQSSENDVPREDTNGTFGLD